MNASTSVHEGGLDSRGFAAYAQDGIVMLDVPADVRDLQQAFLQQCCMWLRTMAGLETTPGDLPQSLVRLAASDRQAVGKLYKISRRFPAVKALQSHPWLVGMAATLMKCDLISCCHFVNVRIDLPGEDSYLLPVHQDFPYIQGSLNAITVWLPFHDTPLLAGPPSWLRGSHRSGVYPVREQRYGGGAVPSGGRSFEIDDPTAFGSASFVSYDVPFGCALVFSTLLLHRSEHNRSSAARLNVQLRFDDACAPESYVRNYPEGLYLHDPFAASYPEYVLRNEQSE